jgi:hypothetical protein
VSGTNDVGDQCAIHGYEPIPASYYRLCGECWHCFVTAAELVEADWDVRRSLPGGEDAVRRQPDDVWVCPHCSHDF